MRLQFDDVTLDVHTRQLLRDGKEQSLVPKAFDLLALLVDNRPRALSKAEIRDHLWPRTFTSESNLSSLVSDLRHALGDDARRARFIRTVHRFGYAFCATASANERGAAARPAPRFRLFLADREIALGEGENILGRGDESVVSLESPTVSRRHARIVIADGHATIEDLRSKNGSYARGQRVRAPAPLEDGDEIRIGRVRLVFRIYGERASTESDGAF